MKAGKTDPSNLISLSYIEKNVRAVLFAPGYNSELSPLIQYRPVPMFKILDKPIIEHIIDFLVQKGIKKFDIVLSHFPHQVEALLEEGHRWGITISYHLARESSFPFIPLFSPMENWEEDHLLIGSADTLPQFNFQLLIKKHIDEKNPIFLFYPSKEWTGWGIFSRANLNSLPSNASVETLPNFFNPSEFRTEKALPFLSVKSFIQWQKTNQKLLHSGWDLVHMPTTAKMIEPGIWVSRATTIHPSAILRAPIFIGENCQIKQNVRIGPNAILENNCVVDHKSIVEDSLVSQRSYIGEGLEIRNCIVDCHILINLALKTHVSLHDHFILAELRAPSFRHYLLRSLGRYLAALFFILLSPLVGALYLRRRLHRLPVVYLPSGNDPYLWKTFDLLSFSKDSNPTQESSRGFIACLPMLINIIKGELHFTGVPPRTVEEVRGLPSDWQRMYLKSKAGLITLAMVEQGKSPTKEEIFASESLYVLRSGLLFDIKICLKWIFKKITFSKT